jgi:hypothetical protein
MTPLDHRDRIIKEIIKPAFKEAGFSTSGNTFLKKEQDFIKLFNIQSSSFNLAHHAAFYLNIGILFPIGFELLNEKTPSKPKITDCTISIRTVSLTGRNQVYEINAYTPVSSIENLIKTDIKEYVVPFFDRFVSIIDFLPFSYGIDQVIEDYRHFVGLTLIKIGEIEAGNKIIDEYIQTASPNWRIELDTFRRKLISNLS